MGVNASAQHICHLNFGVLLEKKEQMKYCLITWLLICIHCTLLHAQSLTCKIVDKGTNEPIPFVNVGIVGKNTGTVSDQEGNFKLLISKDNLNPDDTLRMSSLGYESASFLVKDLNAIPSIIQLKKTVFSLPSITINANDKKNKKVKELGRSPESDKIILCFTSNKLGTELATLIKLKNRKVYLKTANFNISENKFGEISFRVNLYESKNRKPAQNLLKDEIIVTTKMKRGTLSVDLSKYNLILDDDFFLSLEWLQALNGGKFSEDLTFCAGLGKGVVFAKSTSQASWKELTQKKFGFKPYLGFYVEATEIE